MSTNVKKFIKELMPNVVLKAILYLKHFGSNYISDNNIEDISNFKGKYNIQLTQESVIIGNGPSLKHTLSNNLNFFNNKTIFCVNNYATSEYFEIVKPTFYVFADPAYWSKNCSLKLSVYMNNIYSQLRIKVKWQMFLLLPTAAREWNCFLNLPMENENIKLAYYNINPSSESVEKRHILYKKNKAMPHVQTVLVSAIFISLNLGFKLNYIVGGDLSMHENIFTNKNNIVCFYDKHFSNEEPGEAPFWKNSDQTETFRMDEALLAFSKMFKGFLELEEYSIFLNAKIYNASHKSYIDAFERYHLSKNSY